MANLTVENNLLHNEGLVDYRGMQSTSQGSIHYLEPNGHFPGPGPSSHQPQILNPPENFFQSSVSIPEFKATCPEATKFENSIEAAPCDVHTFAAQQSNQYSNSKNETCDQATSSDLKDDNLEHLLRNGIERPPPCNCVADPSDCTATGPFYTQLGFASTFTELREILEKRTGASGTALRIEQAIYCQQEGASSTGCPIAKEIVRRSSLEEKYLVIVKSRPNHSCSVVWQVIAIVVWDGVQRERADQLYDKLTSTLPEFALATERVCEMNSSKTCACQGNDISKEGSSYSFGCSWTVFTDGCKFARSSGPARKFRLSNQQQEAGLETDMSSLADEMSYLLENIAPKAFSNLTSFSQEAQECRIGNRPDFKRPFSGVTSVMDFCAHPHHDLNNINGGCTMVVTLTKPENREFGVNRDDEQLHVLPKYRIATATEAKSSGFERLQEYRCIIGVRKTPKKKKESRSVNKWPTPCRDYPSLERPKIKQPRRPEGSKIKLPKEKKVKDINAPPKVRGKYKKRIKVDPLMANQGPNLGASHETPLDFSLNGASQHNLQAIPLDFSPNGASQQRIQAAPLDFSQSGTPQHHVQATPLDFSQNGTPQHHVQATSYSYPASNNYQSSIETHQQAVQTYCHSSSILTQHGHQDHSTANVQHQVQINHQAENTSGRLPSFSFFNNVASIPQFDGANDHDYTLQDTGPKASQEVQHYMAYCQSSSSSLDQRTLYPQSPNVDMALGNLFKQNPQAFCLPQVVSNPTNVYWGQQQIYTSVYGSYGFTQQVAQAALIESPVNKLALNFNNSPTTFQIPLVENHEFSHLTSPKKYWQVSYDQQTQRSQNGPSGMFFQESPDPKALTMHVQASTENQAEYSISIPEETIPDENAVTYEETDNRDKFGENNVNIGGLALALEHGSVLIECARHELHATTALKNPNRSKPTRIGLVFYQHKKLNQPMHGFLLSKEKAVQKMRNDYKSYFDGTFVPTERQFVKMTEHGFIFPEKVLISRSRKPRSNGGKEIPFDAVRHNAEVYVRDNPVLPKMKQMMGTSI